MTYEKESKHLFESFKAEYHKILKSYEKQDKQYYEEHQNILDGRPPSFKKLKACESKFKEELKHLKNKYNFKDTE